MGAVAWAMRQRPVSHPRSSNRTCGFYRIRLSDRLHRQAHGEARRASVPEPAPAFTVDHVVGEPSVAAPCTLCRLARKRTHALRDDSVYPAEGRPTMSHRQK